MIEEEDEEEEEEEEDNSPTLLQVLCNLNNGGGLIMGSIVIQTMIYSYQRVKLARDIPPLPSPEDGQHSCVSDTRPPSHRH